MLRFRIIRILQITTAILLLGRAWQHLFWGAPFEYLFSEQAGFSPWFVGKVTAAVGWLYVLGLLFTFMLDSRNTKLGYSFVLQAASLLFLAQLYRAENSCQWPTIFLFTAQFASPLIYYLLLFTKKPIGGIMNWLKIALTLTLGGYAWYAMGFYYGQPLDWLQALERIFSISRSSSQLILWVLGTLEILLILFLWVRPLQRIAFGGILIWGALLMVGSVGLFFLEHIHWKAGLRSAWELLCLAPNAAMSFALWQYVYLKKKQDEF